MRDFLPADVRKREYVIGIIKSVYESYGFEPLETPAVENIDTLMGKYGDEGNQLVFRILKRGEAFAANLTGFAGVVKAGSYGEYEENDPSYAIAMTKEFCDLALRYDLTVPLARVVANNKNELPKFFKRYQIQPVWRADRPARGRFREFYQCDVDVIGSESMVVEAELIAAVSRILSNLGFADFVIRINHRDILRKLLLTCGITESRHSDALVSLDKLDKIGPNGVLTELEGRGFERKASESLIDFFVENGKVEEPSLLISILNDFINQGVSGSEDLKHILELCDDAPVRIDLSLARGLSYYTGTIMEINVDGIGSLGGGGRYDGLIGMFGKEQIPACGFSLGLERILVVMEERGMFPPEIADSTPADVMVTIWSDETVADSLKLAAELRSQNLRVTVYPQADKNDKQFKYASQIGVPFLCDLNDESIQSGTVLVKNMTTREKTTVPREKVAETILKSVRHTTNK